MSRLEERFLEKLGDTWENATPGFCVQAFHKGKKIVDIEVGETFPYYDLASLTKIVFSATALMDLHDQKKISITDNISDYVEWIPRERRIKLRDLLSHSAGLTWWYPFYQDMMPLAKNAKSPEEAWFIFEGVLKEKILEDFEKSTPGAKAKAVYSDLDLFLLGLAMEKASGRSLYENWTRLRERMGLVETDFHRMNKSRKAKSKYAPTELDKKRGGIMQGEVHDENTWSLKGVAPHAGLFGPLDELSHWGLLLRGAMLGKKSKAFPSPKTVELFTKRAIPKTRGDWALGFMMPTKGSASSGSKFSPSSVGHTGFTGTSLWFDPKKDLLVTLVSNRVHPTRENKNFVALRPMIHTWIAEEL